MKICLVERLAEASTGKDEVIYSWSNMQTTLLAKLQKNVWLVSKKIKFWAKIDEDMMSVSYVTWLKHEIK